MSESALVSQTDSAQGSFQAGSYTLGQGYQATPGSTPVGSSQSQYVLIQPRGALSGIIADVVVRERGRDILRLTDSPVEKSADITDHAFMLPYELEVDLGYSDSGHGFGYSAAVYNAILALQALRTPFNFTTGKRIYRDMLIASVAQSTDEKTENCLQLSLTLRQVILVSTQATTLPPSDQQAMPDRTADTASTGDKQTLSPPANNDTLALTASGVTTGYTQATGSVPQ